MKLHLSNKSEREIDKIVSKPRSTIIFITKLIQLAQYSAMPDQVDQQTSPTVREEKFYLTLIHHNTILQSFAKISN